MIPCELKEPLLTAENVSLRFGDNLVLRDVNLTVKDIVRTGVTQGQVIAFLGPSGRGKTQFSKILAGLQQPTTGSVTVRDGIPVHAGMVGYVTQNYILRRNRTLQSNLMLAAKMHGFPDAKAKAQEYIELFQLQPFVKQYPAQLSGGQRQRVAIAQQLLCSDHYLIMDEPFSSLDPLMEQKVCDLILRVSLMDELNTLIVISHDIAAALKVADTVWLLGQDRSADGQLVSGSYIKKQYSLIERDLCWDREAWHSAAFNDLVAEIEAEFQNL